MWLLYGRSKVFYFGTQKCAFLVLALRQVSPFLQFDNTKFRVDGFHGRVPAISKAPYSSFLLLLPVFSGNYG